jgi:hypothetical protein
MAHYSAPCHQANYLHLFTYPNAESIYKWAIAINATMGKCSPAERAEFAGATVPDSRRDILTRMTHSGHK